MTIAPVIGTVGHGHVGATEEHRQTNQTQDDASHGNLLCLRDPSSPMSGSLRFVSDYPTQSACQNFWLGSKALILREIRRETP
jgi:hypothetical protein